MKNQGVQVEREWRDGGVLVFSKFMHRRQKCKAFSRIELLSICVALGFLALLVAPTLAANKTDSERLICFNNLRMVGRAVQMWAGDHNQQPPWRTLIEEGGLMPPSGQLRPGNAWFEFAFLSNQLVTPRILTCPSDAGVKRAVEFSSNTNGGLMAVNYRSSAVSYVVGLESVGDAPRSWLSSDRNLGGFNLGTTPCSARVNTTSIRTSPGTPIGWTNAVAHNEFGHILLLDGSVEFTSSPRLKQVLLPPQAEDNGSIHFSRAR